MMNKMTIEDVLKATGAELIYSCIDKDNPDSNIISGIKHDSRDCGRGDMFVAIVGENRNGHDYISSVYEAGCRTVMVSEEGTWLEKLKSEGRAMNIIKTSDTEYAMGELAKSYLSGLNIKKVAVTGSVGKTSVRDMIYYVLSEKYCCGRNLKNYNNLIGLPLSIFQFGADIEAAVLEIGMDRFGEISRLSEIASPDIGVITNIGVAHIEKLGSREGIFEAKMEMAPNIPPKALGGCLVYAKDDYLNRERTAGDYDCVEIGFDSSCDYIISNVDDFGIEGIKFNVSFCDQSHHVHLPIPGAHNAVNATIAIAVGSLLGVGITDAIRGLSKVQLTGSRLKVITGSSVTAIDDTYNANPKSMIGALEALDASPCDGRKVAILGDMYELGAESEDLHRSVGETAAAMNIDRLIAIGENARGIAKGAEGGNLAVSYFESKDSFYLKMAGLIGKNDLILIKASRGMKLEEVVEKIIKL